MANNEVNPKTTPAAKLVAEALELLALAMEEDGGARLVGKTVGTLNRRFTEAFGSRWGSDKLLEALPFDMTMAGQLLEEGEVDVW